MIRACGDHGQDRLTVTRPSFQVTFSGTCWPRQTKDDIKSAVFDRSMNTARTSMLSGSLAGRGRIAVERQLQGHELTNMHHRATALIYPVSNPHRQVDHWQSE
jgi:hypothetical protein